MEVDTKDALLTLWVHIARNRLQVKTSVLGEQSWWWKCPAFISHVGDLDIDHMKLYVRKERAGDTQQPAEPKQKYKKDMAPDILFKEKIL